MGYKGRIGLYEVMPISSEIAKLIMSSANAIEIAAAARIEGIIDLRRAGLNKVLKGLTSIQEINRVTKD